MVPGAHAHASDPLVGATIAHFRVLAAIGRGGMGVVYRAEDLDLCREVALKLLPPGLAGDSERHARLLREARAAASVVHANVATIHEVGQDGDQVFLAMELVHGPTLREALATPMTAQRIAAIGLGIARGLARAHEVGLLHRDLKPENVMLDRDGEPKILDFGIARTLGERIAERSGPLDLGEHSAIGQVVGTPGYMSPEQVRGAVLDARSDVFSLGVVLHELLAGEAPFRGSSSIERMIAVLRETAPPLARSGVPEPVAHVVARCLARDPAARYANAGEVRDAWIAASRALDDDAAPVTLSSAVRAVALARVEPSPDASGGSFFGRERELDDVVSRIERGARLVTVLGPGGIGKTRLAEQVARRITDRSGRPALTIALGAARTRGDLLAHVAGALGADPATERDPLLAIGLALVSRGPVLLVLDDVEPLAREVADLVPRWLASAPALQVLATARERLRARGEEMIELGPLQTERGLELFLARASEARPGATWDTLARVASREIVERLEGSPLAIEIAAARAATMEPEMILARLDDRVRAPGRRSGDARHASLRAVIEWSWSLLGATERATLAQLAVVRASFGVDMAGAIVRMDEGALELAGVLRSLRDNALLRIASEPAPSAEGAEVRLRLDESVRMFAARELARDAAARRGAEARHASWASERAREECRRLREGRGAGARWLAAYRDDLLAVADRALTGGGATLEQAADCMVSLGALLHSRSGAAPVVERLEPIARRAGELSESARADVLTACAELAVLAPEHALERATEALGAARALASRSSAPADDARVSLAASVASRVLLRAGDHEAARARAEEAQHAAGAARAPWLAERALADLAAACWRAGHIDDALGFVIDAVERAEARGARETLPELQNLHGVLCVQQRALYRGEQAYELALAGARDAGQQRLVGMVLNNLGVIAHERSELGLARERYEEAAHILARCGAPMMHGVALGNLGYVEHEQGALRVARAHFDEGIARLAESGDKRYRATYVAARGALSADEGRLASAEQDLGDAEALAREVAEPACRVAVELRRGHVELARSRREMDPELRAAAREALKKRLAAVRAPGDDGASWSERSDIVRVALRLLEHARASAGT